MKQFLAWLIFLVSSTAFAQEASTLGLRLQALKPVTVATQKIWTIHQRDGANREVPPYLSSLAQGESGTGVISSPAFTLTNKTITFTIRGHDGQGGGRQKNFIALVDNKKGITTIRLALNTGAVPRITAITCETDATSDTLLPLPTPKILAVEKSWIDEHAIAADRINLVEIEAKIRRSHKIPAVTFQRSKLSDRAFEGASVCDLNNDGVLDLVSGGFWYQGPAFIRSHKIREVKLVSEYLDDFADYPMDVNGDGYTDLVTGAYFGNPLQWLENPQGKTGLWPVHDISQVGPIETVRCWDVDGDGHLEVVPNAGGNVIFFRLATDGNGQGTGKFTKHVVKMGGCGHGLGFGDINSDGRGDFVVPGGWIESPADPLTGEWIWHHDGLQLGAASVPIGVHDVNEDGKADLIVGLAHGYGLDWFEQTITKSGQRSWVRHPIDRFSSQYHDMQLVDIDNDKQMELVTGKRYRAHNGHDPGSTDPVFIRYYDMEKGRFTGHTIDYGHPQHASGVGIYFWVEDVNQDGWKDILAPGKEGLYLFLNRSFQDLN